MPFFCCQVGVAQISGSGEAQLRIRVLNPTARSFPLEDSRPSADRRLCADKELPGRLEVNEGYLEGAALWLEATKKEDPSTNAESLSLRASQAVQLEIEKCRFKEKLVWLAPGQRLSFHSKDPINYDLRIAGPRHSESFLSLPPNVESVSTELRQLGIYRVTGILHPQVSLALIVQNTPLYGVTDSKGAASIRRVPPGSYRLHLWHPELGEWQAPQVIQVSDRVQDIELVWPEGTP